ncbi:MAG: ATP-dependent Clp protease ATP-binding subunit [Desulfobacterales bacterium]|nr:ATP-dependent Clp protease ATP-binding subunit [Desulfobacterales bacterium]
MKGQYPEVINNHSFSLNIIKYNNPIEEIDDLTNSIIEQGYIPIVWRQASGLMVKHLSNYFPLFDSIDIGHINEPIEIIKFIIKRPQNRVAYILEDFHHYIGEKETLNPSVGEIRSLIKELSRSLNDRSDRVYLFVPNSYELPPELINFFYKSSKNLNKNTVNNYLYKYGQLLTDADYISHIKPLIGGEPLIQRMIQVLTQMESNNPLLIGHPGVGKTALVEGLAKMIFIKNVSSQLKEKNIYSLSLNRLIAGTKYRGDFEIRIEGLMEEVLKNKETIIIFIDEIHTLLDAGASEGSIGAADILKPLLARGEFPCIGATTFEGAEYFFKDPALSRRFKRIIVNPPSIEESIKILRGIAPCFEKYHNIKIEDYALESSVVLSEKYIVKEYLPGKAISILDAAAAYCGMRGMKRLTSTDIRREINVNISHISG